MENFVLTEEIMQKAKTYIPLADKGTLAKDIALQCVCEADTAMQNWIGEKFLPLPHLKQENTELKEILELSVFLGAYLDIDVDATKNSYDNYDFYVGGNVFNQLERFRTYIAVGDKEKTDAIRTKAFDIIADFKTFKKMVDREICNLKEAENDGLARFMAAIAVYASPESIKAALEQLKDIAAKAGAEAKAKEIKGNE